MNPRRATRKVSHPDNVATLGFEKRLWEAADALFGSKDADEYKQVVLGFIFLKHISDISGSVGLRS